MPVSIAQHNLCEISGFRAGFIFFVDLRGGLCELSLIIPK